MYLTYFAALTVSTEPVHLIFFELEEEEEEKKNKKKEEEEEEEEEEGEEGEEKPVALLSLQELLCPPAHVMAEAITIPIDSELAPRGISIS